jgi:hypothetical protein
MISLAALVAEEGIRSDHFGDHFPQMLPVSPPSESPGLTELDHLFAAFRSPLRPLIFWALARLPHVCEHEKRAFKLLPVVLALFTNPHRPLEFAAITCVNNLLKSHARSLSGTLIPRILDRLEQCPAREYIDVLAQILPFCTEATFESCISPMILRFLTREEAFQYAVGELLSAIRFTQIPPSPDLFARFLVSVPIVNEYLVNLVQWAAETGTVGEDWCCRLYPTRLMRAGADNPVIRPGVVRVLLSLLEYMNVSLANSYLAMAVQWGESSQEVALLLLSDADAIVNPSNFELISRLQVLMGRLARSAPPAVAVKLPAILGSNPGVLLNEVPDFPEIVKCLAGGEDSVRRAFLESYFLLFARAPGRVEQDALLTAFVRLFERPSAGVAAQLVAANTYAFFGPGKLMQIAPVFARFAGSLTSWRDIKRCQEAFLSFPREVVRAVWLSVLQSLLPRFAENCHALAGSCPEFCGKLITLIDLPERRLLAEEVVRAFLNHRRWGVRRMLAAVVSHFVGQGDTVLPVMLPVFKQLLDDRISAVVVTALSAWPAVSAACPDETELRARVTSLADSEDEAIRDALTAMMRLESARSLSSRALVPEAQPKIPKIVSAVSGNIRLVGEGQRWSSSSGLIGHHQMKAVRRHGPGMVVKPQKRATALPGLSIDQGSVT